MEHLCRIGSDHAPLMLTAGEQPQQFSKPFRFLKFWVDHESFLYIVEHHWNIVFVGVAFITFKEDIVKIKEQLFDEDPSEANRMKCWDIVGADVYNVVKAFFDGQTLPKSITYTNLVLQQKKEIINSLSDLRPISLSNFINKIITRIIRERLESILSNLISQNQSSFVKRSNIIENVILKLDMAKAYDRVSWNYLIQATSFFHFTRGVKQGDPLSPTLIILAAEVLSRALNSLFDEGMFRGYGLPKWSSNLNHLSYADDTIVFASADKWSLQGIMNILHEYEAVFGQKINVHESTFYMYKKVSSELVNEVQQITGFSRAWKAKLLSFGGKVVLISSVLQSIPVYLLSAMVPPKCVIKELHKLFNRFFWQTTEDGKCKHWSEWIKLCYPKGEGGLGFRSLNDISRARFSKLWWRFRTNNSLWSNFMWNKYCKKVRPTLIQWNSGTQTWKYMLEARNDIEQHIWWEPHQGSTSIWYDNWLKIGASNNQP
ncbi:uncharacterized protein LOC132619964 [Lycium barbarum]|uniref:uncharacterized protein LOC132619964 n=1 Tax=Lycium barbarum TaxID=112863 RepID=UPI00293F76DE|nr:uncharacterized protein LOC132619964 [Lycium barbarum]